MTEEVKDYCPAQEIYDSVGLLRDIVRRVALDSFEYQLDPDDAAAAVLLVLVDIVHEGTIINEMSAIDMVRNALGFASSALIARQEAPDLVPEENENEHDPIVVEVLRRCNFS
jgi:hypothetical protein